MHSVANNGIRRSWAFTIIELLVVLAIIGLLTVIGIPMMKGIGRSNVMASATRQLMDDLALARHKAMVGRTTVHVVFVPEAAALNPNVASQVYEPDYSLYMRLRTESYASYALFAERTPGDQPGQPTKRYLTKWKSLPEGVFIATSDFEPLAVFTNKPFERVNFPVPSVGKWPTVCPNIAMPHVAFDRNGRLVRGYGNTVTPAAENEDIWLTRGSILVAYDANGKPEALPPREDPPGNWLTNYNRIVIDSVTGRARIKRPEIQ